MVGIQQRKYSEYRLEESFTFVNLGKFVQNLHKIVLNTKFYLKSLWLWCLLQAGSCHYRGGAQEAATMSYYRIIDGGEEEILRTVAEQGPVLVSIDHRTRTFMVSLQWNLLNMNSSGTFHII